MNTKQLSLYCLMNGLDAHFFLKNVGGAEDMVHKRAADMKLWTQEQATQASKKWKNIMSLDIDVVTPVCADYPRSFWRIPRPPVCLSLLGNRSFLKEPALSVIGSRNPHPHFISWIEHEYALFLQKTKVTTVSGGAIGIDQKASQVALLHQLPTIVFLPSGVHNMYPAAISDWRWNKNILFISEYLPAQPMMKYLFLRRNQLIAAYSQALFVVQGSLKSGTMMTTKYAIELNHEVATLPDFPTVQESSGNLQLLRDGAGFILNSKDLVDWYLSVNHERVCSRPKE